MAKSYYSTVLDHGADEIWAVIRAFDHYAWAGVEAETSIEAGKAGDQVGAVRRVNAADRTLRQRLLAHSDVVRNYVATIRVTPVVDGDKAFVEWWATFNCAPEEHERWTNHFEKQGFAKWLASLRDFMDLRKVAV